MGLASTRMIESRYRHRLRPTVSVARDAQLEGSPDDRAFSQTDRREQGRLMRRRKIEQEIERIKSLVESGAGFIESRPRHGLGRLLHLFPGQSTLFLAGGTIPSLTVLTKTRRRVYSNSTHSTNTAIWMRPRADQLIGTSRVFGLPIVQRRSIWSGKRRS